MTTTFLGSITRLGVLLDEDVMVYADLPNSAVAVPTGSAVEVTLTERSVMVAERTESMHAVADPSRGAGARTLIGPRPVSAASRSRGHRVRWLLGAVVRPDACLGPAPGRFPGLTVAASEFRA